MRRLLPAIAIVLLAAASARAAGLNWDVASFDVAIKVRADGALEVAERIVADFSHEAHHGIVREIPFAYRRSGTDYHLRIELESVDDGAGGSWPVQVSRRGGMLRLRIGDADRTLSGPSAFIIRYTVRRALLAFETHDELYWNATGDQWPVPIRSASCTITLAQPPDAKDLQLASFVGPHGATSAGPPGVIEGGAILFQSGRALSPWTGLTVVVGFPKGLAAAPTAATRVLWFLRDNLMLGAPLVVFGLLFLLWRSFGRDLGTPGSIAVEYDAPDGLSPAEVGTIIDERVDMRDITASIVNLAVRGHLRIDASRLEARSRSKDASSVRLIRTGRGGVDLKPFEKRILDGLFEEGDDVFLRSLQTRFFTTLPELKDDLYRSLAAAGYFDGHLGLRRGGWIAAGFIGAALAVGAGIALASADVFAPLSTMVAAVLTAVMIPVFAFHMPRKTAKGRRAMERVKGLEEFIARAELPELELAAKQTQFEKLLPYAMALNLAPQWARKFEGLYSQPPQWCDMGRTDSFSTWWMVNTLLRTNSAMGRSMLVAPRSAGGGSRGWTWSSGGAGGGSSGFGGGGFSGGGFGGGGGHAW